MDIPINFWAVLAAGVASFIVGSAWYSPVLFGKIWIQLMGRTEEDIKKSSPVRAMTINFILTLITAYVLAHFAQYAEAATVVDGLTLGFWVWLGFVATIGYNTVIFEGKSNRLFAINTGYQLLSLLVMAAILSVWG